MSRVPCPHDWQGAGDTMTRREQILEHIRIAAYEGDERKALRLYVENRISYPAYAKARETGIIQRGMISHNPDNQGQPPEFETVEEMGSEMNCQEIAKGYYDAVRIVNHAQAIADRKNRTAEAAQMRRVQDYLWFMFISYAQGEMK